MEAVNTIQQGQSLDFKFDRGGESIDNWVCTIEVYQFRGTSPIITRVVTPLDEVWQGILTEAETSLLEVGTHQLLAVLVNATDDEQETVQERFHVSKAWIQ